MQWMQRKISREPPPGDTVLQHKEKVLFVNLNTGIDQLSREPHNVYYHYALSSCVVVHFCDFNASMHIRVDGSIGEREVDAMPLSAHDTSI